jgi:DNA-directed RNA polymerase subunit D
MADYDIEIIEADDRSAEFVVRGITPAFANGVRRAMLADVPTLSIDTVRMIENSSVMFDEVIGLRLGLVPLTTPDDVREDDVITLSLDVEGPATAYSGDIETSDDLVEPAAKNVPIIELKEGQRLAFEAEATLAYGKDHAKHQSGVAVGYRHLKTVEIEGEVGEYDDRDPHIVRGVIEEDGELVHAAEFDNDLTNRYPDREVSVHDVENAFVFDVESDGSLSVDELVTEAARSIADRADELEDAVAL